MTRICHIEPSYWDMHGIDILHRTCCVFPKGPIDNTSAFALLVDYQIKCNWSQNYRGVGIDVTWASWQSGCHLWQLVLVNNNIPVTLRAFSCHSIIVNLLVIARYNIQLFLMTYEANSWHVIKPAARKIKIYWSFPFERLFKWARCFFF